MMTKFFLGIALSTLLATNAYAFHAVSEILPSGKILICQDYNQIKKGDTADVYAKFRIDTDRNVKMVKKSEISLPKVGEKVKLTHSDFHQVGTTAVTEYHSEDSGTAIVIEPKQLLGEKRFVRKAPNEARNTDFSEMMIIGEKEVEDIASRCLVAIPEGSPLTELKKVSW